MRWRVPSLPPGPRCGPGPRLPPVAAAHLSRRHFATHVCALLGAGHFPLCPDPDHAGFTPRVTSLSSAFTRSLFGARAGVRPQPRMVRVVVQRRLSSVKKDTDGRGPIRYAHRSACRCSQSASTSFPQDGGTPPRNRPEFTLTRVGFRRIRTRPVQKSPVRPMMWKGACQPVAGSIVRVAHRSPDPCRGSCAWRLNQSPNYSLSAVMAMARSAAVGWGSSGWAWHPKECQW